MKLSAPIPWALVPVGAVVLAHDGVPRTVLVNTSIVTMIEGLPPRFPTSRETVQLVVLDEADAIATLTAADLNPEPIEESGS
jgi:hypothetical protein